MKLFNIETNQNVDAEIQEINSSELDQIDKSNRFSFEWGKEIQNSVIYKITQQNHNLPLGLISIKNIPKEYRVHIRLLESSGENKGKNKQFDHIAGCLIAYSAKLSFENGYGGFVSLIPKTELMEHYIRKYGFRQIGTQLAISGIDAITLIDKYVEL